MDKRNSIQLHNGLAKEGDRLIGCGELNPVHATLKRDDNGHLTAFDDEGNGHLIITYDDYFFISFAPDEALEAVDEVADEMETVVKTERPDQYTKETDAVLNALKKVSERINEKRRGLFLNDNKK